MAAFFVSVRKIGPRIAPISVSLRQISNSGGRYVLGLSLIR
jgi:hypothetical protein